jgi:hypothetical protein
MHGERGHADPDAHRDGCDHEHRHDGIAAHAPEREIEVVSEHVLIKTPKKTKWLLLI